MNINNIELIKEFLEIPIESDVNSYDSLEDFNWDSLAMINIQSFFIDHNNLEINPDELEDLKNIADLDNFISKHL